MTICRIAFAISLVLTAPLQARDCFIVRDAKPQARIYLPRALGKATLLAANEFGDYIEKMTDARVPVDRYGSGEKRYALRGESRIYLRPKIDPTQPISADGSEDVFTITEKHDTLTIEGNSDTAVLYGVYQYLGDLGVRWYMPGEIGENMPRRTQIKIGRSRKTYTPSFRKREIDYSGYDRWHFHPQAQERQHHQYDLWLLRNRCHFSRSIHWRSIHRFDFNWTREYTYHNVAAVLRKVDIKKVPGRFALVTQDGETRRRTPRERAQICFTHPKNVTATVDAAVQWFEERPDKLTYPTSLQDCGGICECANCIEANAGVFPPHDPNRVVWKFMNAVARGLSQRLPQKRIAFYACYGSMTEPPAGMSAAPGVVAVTCHVQSNRTPITDPDCPFNRTYLSHLRRIRETGAEMECYEYSMFAGTPQPLAILSNVKTYADLGYVGYHTESMGRDEQRKIIAWVQAQLAWDASRDPQELLETFCRDYYGTAGEDVLNVLHLIDASVRKLPKIILGSAGVTQSIMTDAVIAEGRQALKQALRKVSGRERDRLARFQSTFEVFSRQGQLVRAVYDAMRNRSEEAKQKATQQIEQLGAFWEEADLSETCSPAILERTKRLSKVVAGITPEVTPLRSKALANATRDELIAEMFSRSETPPDTKAIFLLPELWRFRLDVHRDAKDQGWTSADFDNSGWHTLSTWNFYERQGFDRYDGAFCYRVKFKAPTFDQGAKIFLRIGALDDEGDVYVNGQLMHRRLHLSPDDWQSSFEMDVTSAIRLGANNVIAVCGNDEYGVGGVWKPCGLYSK